MSRPRYTVFGGIILIALVLACVLAPRTQAQQRMSLRDAINMFAENNLELQAARSRAAEMSGLARQAAAYPNPSALVTHEPVWRPDERYSETYFNLTQRIEWPGLRSARIEAAEQMAAAATAGATVDSLRLLFEVANLYARTAKAMQSRETLSSIASTFRDADRANVEMVAEGDESGYAMLRMRIERARYEQRLSAAELEARNTFQQLALLIAPEDEDLSVNGVEALPPVPSDVTLDAAMRSALNLRPELERARADVEAAASGLALARRERLPDPAVTAGYKRQSNGFKGLFVGTTVPLPIFDRNQGSIQAGNARLTAAQSRLALAEAYVRKDLRSAYERYTNALERRSLIVENLLADTDALRTAARVGYQEGELSLNEFLDATQAHTDALLTRLEVETDLQVAFFDLLRASGGQLDDLSYTANY